MSILWACAVILTQINGTNPYGPMQINNRCIPITVTSHQECVAHKNLDDGQNRAFESLGLKMVISDLRCERVSE